MRRRIIFALFASAFVFGACTRERPPPRVCEMPPPTKKKEDIRIGACPVEWGSDGGTDALETSVADAHSED